MVSDVLENFVSKVGQHIEVLKLEEFGPSLFIDSELQVAEKDEKKYSGQFVGSALNLSKNKSENFDISSYKKENLLNGYDDIDFLNSIKNDITNFEKKSPL